MHVVGPPVRVMVLMMCANNESAVTRVECAACDLIAGQGRNVCPCRERWRRRGLRTKDITDASAGIQALRHQRLESERRVSPRVHVLVCAVHGAPPPDWCGGGK